MERRGFMLGCAGAAMGATLPTFAAGEVQPRLYNRVRLVAEGGRPLKTRRLPAQRNFIFHYPYASTPCFLLNLGKPLRTNGTLKTADRRSYEWRGGTGAGDAIVAYSAICAHKLTYPTRDISFIGYREAMTPGNRHAQVIHCCSEHSQYDPAQGAKVLAGPAPQPLAAILLEYDRQADELYAVGTLGGEMFNDFFSRFEFKLSMEHGGKPRAPVEGTCVVTEMDNYCRQQVRC
jgi:arsenite oxidase small subunit